MNREEQIAKLKFAISKNATEEELIDPSLFGLEDEYEGEPYMSIYDLITGETLARSLEILSQAQFERKIAEYMYTWANEDLGVRTIFTQLREQGTVYTNFHIFNRDYQI